MLIRCEKCSTLYELDEKLLPPQGAPVQCSKCQFVFKAWPAPPRQAGTLDHAANDAPVPEEGPTQVGETLPPEEHEAPRARREEVVREGGALAHTFERPAGRAPPTPAPRPSIAPPTTGQGLEDSGDAVVPGQRSTTHDEQKFTADGRPIRKVPFPVGDPPHPGPRMPPIRTGTAKTRNMSRMSPSVRRALIAALVLAVLIAAAVAWRVLGRDVDAEGARGGQSRPAQHGGTAGPPARN